MSPCAQGSVCGCPGLQVRAQSSVPWLGYSSTHRAHACMSLGAVLLMKLPQQKSQAFVAGFGQQIAADLEYGVRLGLSCLPSMGWMSTTCSALWDICLCSCVQFVGQFLLWRAVEASGMGLSAPAGSHCRDPSSQLVHSFFFI